MIILLGSYKGGCGKSTLATSLAAMLAGAGGDVVLVDADKQSTASTWAADREADPSLPAVACVQKYDNIRQTLLDLDRRYSHVVVDCAGHDSKELRTGMTAAHVMLSPFRPSQPDLDTAANQWLSLSLFYIAQQPLAAHLCICRDRFADSGDSVLCKQWLTDKRICGGVRHETRFFKTNRTHTKKRGTAGTTGTANNGKGFGVPSLQKPIGDKWGQFNNWRKKCGIGAAFFFAVPSVPRVSPEPKR